MSAHGPCETAPEESGADSLSLDVIDERLGLRVLVLNEVLDQLIHNFRQGQILSAFVLYFFETFLKQRAQNRINVKSRL